MSITKIGQKVTQNITSAPVKKASKTAATLLAASALVFGPMGCKTTSDSFTSTNTKANTAETANKNANNKLIDKKTGTYMGGAGIIGLSATAGVFGGPGGWAVAAIGIPSGLYIMAKEALSDKN